METKTLTKAGAAAARRMFKIFSLIARGATISTACQEMHVTPQAYRNWLVDNPESVTIIQRTISAMERVNLASIATARSRVLNRLIEAVDLRGDMELSPRALLEIDIHLHNLQAEIEEKHGANAREDLSAQKFLLTGPKLHKATARIPGTTVNIKEQPDGSVDVTLMKAAEIIEGEVHDIDMSKQISETSQSLQSDPS